MGYTVTKITHKIADKLLNDKNWKWICEAESEVVYWNKESGELLWYANLSKEVSYQKVDDLSKI